MNRKSLLLLLSAICTLAANAQIFWKVTPPDANARPSYIFGTHHGAPAAVADRFALSDYYALVDTVYGEVSPDELTTPDASLTQLMVTPADSTLDKLYTPDELGEIDRALTDITGQPGLLPMINAMKPAVISTMLLQHLLPKALPDFDINQQLDLTILAKAKEAGKPVRGLESVGRQMQALFNTPVAYQAKELLEELRQEGYGVNKLRSLTDAYMANDLTHLQQIMEAELPDGDPQHVEMIEKRNAEWVNFLIGFLPTTSALIVVGAGHLPGNAGLLDAFRSAGYNVEPIAPKN